MCDVFVCVDVCVTVVYVCVQAQATVCVCLCGWMSAHVCMHRLLIRGHLGEPQCMWQR